MRNIIDHNINIIAIEKNGKNYGMCCAWATQVDYDKILCVLGRQSTTGNIITMGDIVGFSNLQKEQIQIALQLGDTEKHSSNTDKLKGIDYYKNESAILIKGAKAEVKCKVIEVLHIQQLDSENLIYMQVLNCKENEGNSLHMSDMNF